MLLRPLITVYSKSAALLLSTLALGLAGCSTPLVTPQPPTFQSKMGYVADWEALADRTAKHFIKSLGGQNQPVYVAPGPADMPFAAAYRNLLEEKLRRHLNVKQTAEGATVLRFGVQTFLYNDRHQKLPVTPGTLGGVALALSVPLRTISSLDTKLAAGAVAGPLLDLLIAMNDTTNAEAVLTVTALNADGSYLAYRDTSTFYIQPRELPFYWTQVPESLPQAKQAILEETSLPVTGPSYEATRPQTVDALRGAEHQRRHHVRKKSR